MTISSKPFANRRGWWIALSAILCFSFLAVAQETTGGIQGTVKDPSGATISGATVEVTSPALIGIKKAQTDGTGGFRFDALPAGDYTLTVTSAGFRTARETGIALAVGRLPNIDIQMQVGALAETVEVTGAALAVDVTQSKVAVTVDRVILDNIPKGRSFQSVIPFAPGARQEPLQSTTGGRDGGFQIDGASDSENVYLIDGVNTTNIQNGGVGKNFQMEFIQEVQIKSSSFEAEYGGALGGVINAVPKRGSNNWHGEVLTYFRSNKLNANDACASGLTSSNFSTVCGLRLNPTQASLSTANRLDGTPEYYIPKKDQRTIVEPGFTLGGPLLKDKLWLFTSYV
ncbi:MAG: TonB-dependent receptor, partial [Acidobacteriota bacterium]|nr:TonB-dependent receptor [Acidobacteriota bacterium]